MREKTTLDEPFGKPHVVSLHRVADWYKSTFRTTVDGLPIRCGDFGDYVEWSDKPIEEPK
jgi:hypothetical protein